MFWNITADNWAQLWSGIIGAVLAAGVAMLVVWRTNKHQSRLASDQLDEQRKQANTTRRVEALSDVAAVVSALAELGKDEEAAAADLVLKAQAALIRWRMNGGQSENAEALEDLIKYMTRVRIKFVHRASPGTAREEDLKELALIFADVKRTLYRVADWEHSGETDELEVMAEGPANDSQDDQL